MVADLSGNAALIAGAASGIGRASALAFASAGASVALLDIDAEGLADTAAAVRAAGTHAEMLVADVRDLRAVTGAVGARGSGIRQARCGAQQRRRARPVRPAG
jgi:NADP-dependent 3-hydroxy acid dehydrogenase YdfG